MVGNAYEKHEHTVDWKVRRVNASESVTKPGVWKSRVGYTKNPTYRRLFTSAICANLVGNQGAHPPPKKLNLRSAEM